MRKPAISIIMPVNNSEKYIESSVNSILNQTLTDFEFIIIDDASTDGTSKILKQISDQRVSIITNFVNLGNYPSRNIGIRASSGDFICVMDSDDLALPYRLERQMHFMLNNPDIGISSVWFWRFGTGGNIPISYPADDEWLKIKFLENNYCLHPGLCIRKGLLPNEESLLYNENYRYASDYDFVSRNFKHFRICNIPEILMEYRIHPAQITSSKFAEQQQYADIIRINYLQNLGLTLNDKEKTIHLSLIKNEYNPYCDLKEHIAWCNKMLEYNFHIQFFNTELLAGYLREKLMWQRRMTESRNIETLKPTN
jgi:glycosyltransferase involved in cell wall biosynthesis